MIEVSSNYIYESKIIFKFLMFLLNISICNNCLWILLQMRCLASKRKNLWKKVSSFFSVSYIILSVFFYNYLISVPWKCYKGVDCIYKKKKNNDHFVLPLFYTNHYIYSSFYLKHFVKTNESVDHDIPLIAFCMCNISCLCIRLYLIY